MAGMVESSRALMVGLWVALAAYGCATAGQGDDDGGNCAVGSEGCDCTSGGGCDDGLLCLSGFCVSPGSMGGATAASSPAASSTDATVATGSSTVSSSVSQSVSASSTASSTVASSSSSTAASSSSSGGGSCAHSPCVQGVGLDASCGTCPNLVCNTLMQSDCCTLTWDLFCVDLAYIYCSSECS